MIPVLGEKSKDSFQCTTALLTCYAVHDASKAPVESDTLGNYRAPWTAALARTLANKIAVPKPLQRKCAVITACGSARDKPLCQLQSRVINSNQSRVAAHRSSLIW